MCSLIALGALLAAIAVPLGFAGCRRQEPAAAAPASEPRIAALSPALTVTLRDLGEQPRIVARHGYDMVLDPALPVGGDQTGIDYERLLAVRPTHVLLQWGIQPVPQRLKALAGEHGWNVLNTNPATLSDIRASVRTIADFVGADPAAASTLEERLDRAWAKRDGGFADLGGVLLLASVSPPAALGPGSCHQELLERLGATPALTSGGMYVEMDHEDLLRLAPGVIIALAPGPPRTTPAGPFLGEAAIARLEFLASLDLPAVRAKRVAVIDDPLALTPSTALAGLADTLARVLEALRHYDPPPQKTP